MFVSDFAVVGSGSTVVSEIEQNAVVAGVPARPLRARKKELGLSGRIFLSPPSSGPEELEAVRQALESGYLAPIGPDVDAFEKELAEYSGVPHAVAVSSGTAALHLALLIAGVKSGDTVFCSDLTFVAAAAPIRYCGATPLFIDSDLSTWNMDPALLERALEDASQQDALPKAVVVVHGLGLPADVPRLSEICERYGVTCIEDAADFFGGVVDDRPVGWSARMTALSFNGNKIVSASSGGALLCRNAGDADRARHLAFMARRPGPHYEHSELGFSYGLSNVCAAIGRAQLQRLPERRARKESIFNGYVARLWRHAPLNFMPLWSGGRPNFWLSCVTFGSPLEMVVHNPDALLEAQDLRDAALIRLWADDIDARPMWYAHASATAVQ